MVISGPCRSRVWDISERADHKVANWLSAFFDSVDCFVASKKGLRAAFARASRAGRWAAKAEPRAARAAYRTRVDALWIELTDGAVITIPRKLIPDLKRAAIGDVKSVEALGRGSGLHWETLDLYLRVPALVSSVFAGSEWIAELARVGGQSSRGKAVARGFGERGLLRASNAHDCAHE